MNQRIAVRAIIRKDDKTLFLRRAHGRETILGKFELPGGRLQYGEQPEDALTRYLKDDAGVTPGSIQLFDVISYIDHDYEDIQYVLILYLVALSGGSGVDLGDRYDRYVWKKTSSIQQDEITESSKLLLGISQQVIQEVKEHQLIGKDVINTSIEDHLIVYTDGGSRGNPGPSAAGFIVMSDKEHVVHEGGMYLGVTTNNQAEYQAVMLGLEKALEMGAKAVDVRLDSLLVVNQMNGLYDIKNRELWPVHERIKSLITKFDKVTFMHVRREFNQLADGMVNKILDARSKNTYTDK